MVENVVVAGLLVTGARPPVREQLPGRRDHRRDEDEEVDRNADAYERCGKAAERVAHDHDVATVADRLHNGVGVFLPTSRLVLAREVDGDHIVPALAQRRGDQMPVPSAPTTAVDECERRHRGHGSAATPRRWPQSATSPVWTAPGWQIAV